MRKLNTLLAASAAVVAMTGATFAADLIIEEPFIPEVGVVDVGGDWEGAYVGVFVGYGWGTADHNNAEAPSPCEPLDGCDVDMDGFLAGLTAGANFYLSDGIVGGIAGDIAWSNVNGTEDFGGLVGESENSIDWQGSLRGVLGFDAGAFMPYLTAGLAVAHGTHYSEGLDAEGSATHFGWTAGVGVAVAVADNISLDLQYRYSDFGTREYEMDAAPVPNPEFRLTQHAVTAGVNFGF